MRIGLTSIFVFDQAAALEFYTTKLGFVLRQDIPLGEYRFLTVGEQGADVELLLEPNVQPAANAYQQAIYAAGIPMASFFVDDIEAECARLQALGVEITMPPTTAGAVTLAVLDDTCGNLIQIAQV